MRTKTAICGAALLLGASGLSLGLVISSGAAPATALGVDLPGLSDSIITAVDNTDMTITAAPASATAAESEASAESTALAQLPVGSVANAASLVVLADGLYPNGRLAWAVADDPAGPHVAAAAYMATAPPPTFNFRVDFIDATSGQWLQADMGAAPNLPALPIISSSTQSRGASVPQRQFGGIERLRRRS